MKILVVGDIHGEWGKLNTLISRRNPHIILQCGDFGYWPSMEVMTKKPVLYGRKEKPFIVHGVKARNTNVYWCDGNHEEFPHLKEFNDGKIHELYPNVNYASRGSTLTLPDDRVVLFMGGASSVDKGFRTPGFDWFPEENISNLQLERALSHSRVDIVISHTCPSAFQMRGYSDDKITDPNRFALDAILLQYKPSRWYFGHWHRSKYGEYEATGTKWLALDYPKHGGNWWTELY